MDELCWWSMIRTRTVESLVAKVKALTHETVSGHAFSNAALISSTTSSPRAELRLGMEPFSLIMLPLLSRIRAKKQLCEPLLQKLTKTTIWEFATIDTTGKYNNTQAIKDYISVISLTPKLPDEANATCRIRVDAISGITSEPTPSFLKSNGIKSVPKSVTYGFMASGYGFVQDMPHTYVHEFTRSSMAGNVRRFIGGYASVCDNISIQLPTQIHCNMQALTVNHDGDTIKNEAKFVDGEKQNTEFNKHIVSRSFPINRGKTYRSPSKTTNNRKNENGSMEMGNHFIKIGKEVFVVGK
ncbi:hypothetical protein L2E82_05109 [Cichorium intybus]|uniref:Uncharacterized protein n=1 Tax=Cichorium intybus TaxID=13427 RepID=A0ACB9H6M1_CICIN|nr:hypothetical protein L2E82_05109 [Cichorium intybus]